MNTELKIQTISQELKIPSDKIKATLKLLDEGSTIPFIARYRKEITGALDEVQIHSIEQRFQYLENLGQRKEEVLRLIEEQGKLNDEIIQAVEKAVTLQAVEDIYTPFKQKKKTKAMIAIENGLEPLAEWILNNQMPTDINEQAKKYRHETVPNHEEAIAGVIEIIAQRIAENIGYREFARKYFQYNGELTTSLKDQTKDADGVYRMYYDFKETIQNLKNHHVLAINRAEKEGAITVKIHADQAPIIRYIQQRFVKEILPQGQVDVIEKAILESHKRFISPAIEREIRNHLTEKADLQAIEVFGDNLRNLLLTKPFKGKTVMGFDPAYRTGCKLAIINEYGQVLDKAVIYPHQQSKVKDDEETQRKKWASSQKKMTELIHRYQVDLIAIGNGTASRESEAFVADVIKGIDRPVRYLVVSEAGASVYSASEIAREEFPDWEASQRSAVSIARRVQDPLAELIKIDPKAMGIGQYQHDVAQKELNAKLAFVINVAVNQVGVDINTASVPLLQHVSGLTKATAQNIITLRNELGGFSSRRQVKNVKRLGPKTYEQAIGFMRVLGGDNPLDQTNIHPESYKIAQKILKDLDVPIDSIGSSEANEKLDALNLIASVDKYGVGKETLKDIINGLKHPTADIRDGQTAPLLRQDVLSFDDLTIGLMLEGVVRNVVDFGAFVDIGVKQDGLIHISKLSQRRVKHPSEVVSVGNIVEVEISELDPQRQRIGLTLKSIK